jgi:tRNA/rRNA methyltransferase
MINDEQELLLDCNSYKRATAIIQFIETSKKRIKRYDAHSPLELGNILTVKQGMLQHVSLVFGSEENGLSTRQLDHCDLISTIPLATDYPSLNLAQSVLIYAWELNSLLQEERPSNRNDRLQKLLIEEVLDLLDQLGIADKPLLTRRIMDRVALLNTDDSQLLMNILSKLKKGS